MGLRYELRDLDIIYSEDILKDRILILWGTREKGKYVYEMLKEVGVSIDFCCDSDTNLWGSEFFDNVIVSPFELKKKELINPLIILAVSPISIKPIIKTLGEIIIGYYDIVTYFGISNLFRFNYDRLFENNYIKGKFQLEALECQEFSWQYTLGFLNSMMYAEDGDLFILQPGKVGSSTLQQDMSDRGLRVRKIHYIAYPRHILGKRYEQIWKIALENLKSKKIKIITGVREPIARDISAFWQTFSEGNVVRADLISIKNSNIFEMYQKFIKLISKGNAEIKSVCGETTPQVWCNEFEWFDEEIKKELKIDIYQFPFDKEKGFQIIENNNLSIFVYKLEMLDDVYSELIKFATDGKDAVVTKNIKNRGDQKWFGLAYKHFLEKVKIDSQYVDSYYKKNSKVDHFYSEEEKAKFLNRWKENILK